MFRVPGVGGLLFDAIGARDRSVVVVVANAVADVVVASLDPRLRLKS